MKTRIFEKVPNLLQILATNTFFQILIVSSLIRTENPCKTPDNFNGTCIAVKQCRPISRLMQTELSMERRNFWRSSQCDGDGDGIFVCCPNAFTVDDLPSTKYCGTQVADKIIGGEETSLNEFPWYEPNLSAKTLQLHFL